MKTFQSVILSLQRYWTNYGCSLLQPLDAAVGAGTFHYGTFLRSLGPEPWSACYVQPSRRPADGRYAENPNRLQRYYQFQTVIKPAPKDLQEVYLASLSELGLDERNHDIRFVEDNWHSPTLGAWGLGWEVWLDGMEISQITYFQEIAGIKCQSILAEITYGLERLSMYLQKIDNVFDLIWNENQNNQSLTYGDIWRENEIQQSSYNFEDANPDALLQLFELFEKESYRLVEKELPIPSYDMAIQCSHIFNVLDASKAISDTERVAFIKRIRSMSHQIALLYLKQREEQNFPLLHKHTGT
ncbi:MULTISPECIES: glycine--tRNA ligase subunit alpha [Candidatus Ichthyocystis]|uniref:Glycine--tRNA ligase alpha subunit n=2 Tax=Candidatus Ichthyocystis TaxID=2929841 RepID=A0A0S4M0S8_9BURK|nr:MULTISPECIES: glycine--tRNA ligase subunit alpha [Ichthyocystis]CUT17411.1 glycyl-tRNA synthetase subunit alpha [Candidatus Ichthyocystis hellenicum]